MPQNQQTNFIQLLRSRNLIAQTSHENELIEILNETTSKHSLFVYAGFDPTAASLHVGNLAVLMLLRRAQDEGLTPIILFGGATGRIGDPTGRTEMRQMNTETQIQSFIENFKKIVSPLFRNDSSNKPIYVNNLDWVGPMTWLDFSQNVGVHFTVARLLAAEVNKTRFQEGGLTFMELGYQLLQSYDFLHLYEKYHCTIQFGGDDQWSNILSGADLIRRTKKGKAFAVTTPLLVDKNDVKFGKSAGNAIWLDPSMTSPYEFFQFFRNVYDEDVEKLFYVFSLKTKEEIQSILKNTPINESKEILAFEITKFIHGEQEATNSQNTARSLFSNDASELLNLPTTTVTLQELKDGFDILSLLVKCEFATSRGEARKLIQGGGFYLNQEKWTQVNYPLTENDFMKKEDKSILLRKGKKEYHKVLLG